MHGMERVTGIEPVQPAWKRADRCPVRHLTRSTAPEAAAGDKARAQLSKRLPTAPPAAPKNPPQDTFKRFFGDPENGYMMSRYDDNGALRNFPSFRSNQPLEKASIARGKLFFSLAKCIWSNTIPLRVMAIIIRMIC
jgi:hypothetical protein